MEKPNKSFTHMVTFPWMCVILIGKQEFVDLLREENVLGRHKEMPGRTYEVIYQDDHEATVKCTYLCPYCNQETTAQITVYSDGFDLLVSGGFFEPLECEYCNKTTDVRFWSNQRI